MCLYRFLSSILFDPTWFVMIMVGKMVTGYTVFFPVMAYIFVLFIRHYVVKSRNAKKVSESRPSGETNLGANW